MAPRSNPIEKILQAAPIVDRGDRRWAVTSEDTSGEISAVVPYKPGEGV